MEQNIYGVLFSFHKLKHKSQINTSKIEVPYFYIPLGVVFRTFEKILEIPTVKNCFYKYFKFSLRS